MLRLVNLKEKVLIRKAYLYFLIPAMLIGVLGFFFPLFYAIVPAHESGFCI